MISKQTARTSRTRDDPAARLPDVLQFMQLLWAVVHGVDRMSKRMSAEIGITGPQRLVLRVAGLFPGVSAGDLATILHVHPSTLTGVLQRLVRQRLLVRRNDATDRRRAVLNLTARGRRRVDTARGTVESAVAEALKGASPRDRAATQRVLERLASHLVSTDADPIPRRQRRDRRQRTRNSRGRSA